MSIQSHRLIGDQVINIFFFIVALLSPLVGVYVVSKERLSSLGTPSPDLSCFHFSSSPGCCAVRSVGRPLSLFSALPVRFVHLIYELAFIIGRRAYGKSFLTVFAHVGWLRFLYLLNCSSLDCERDDGKDLNVGFTFGSEFFKVLARVRWLGFL